MPDVEAVAEDLLQINCPAAGYPLHSISWEKGTVTALIFICRYVV
jgi:hypothetical protein